MNKVEKLNRITETIISMVINIHCTLGPELLESDNEVFSDFLDTLRVLRPLR